MRIYPTVCALLICLAGFMLMYGCTNLRNEVDPNLLGAASTKLVVSGFISPQDTVLAIKVTRSNTVVGDSISLLQTGSNVTDATVTLSDGSKTVRLPYNNIPASDTVRSRPYYSINAKLLPVTAGRTYSLTVVTANGQRATSTCTIPAAVPLRAIMINDSVNRRYSISIKWQDPAGQANYYQAAGIFRYIAANCKACQNEVYNTLSFDDDSRGLISDVGYEGVDMSSGRAYLTSAGTPNFYNYYRTASVTANLMSVDQTFYRFQDAAMRQRRSRNNPFAEPVIIPSNIEGGLGCFAGYNNATMTLKLK